MINPFIYGVDLLKHALLGGAVSAFPADFGIGLDLIVVWGFILVASLVSCLRFSHEASLGALGFLRNRQS